MMRSLWSGVSGLRVHQVGMDVEGNNIANVNTYGFKYSRVNYSTMFSQTMSIATQPTANLGGRNAKQVGLGVEATATQRIHSQGNMQTTDSNYDVAISGNGFFLVSNDGGKTQYLTRDGAFNQDAAGNFVNSSGYVVQGWVRDPVTGRIDTSLPAGNLSWDPSMSIPANPSSRIYLNASLNSGRKISEDTSRYLYSLDSVHDYRVSTASTIDEDGDKANQFYTTSSNAIDVTEKAVDFAAIFNSDTYESLNLRNGQSFWFSYQDATFDTAGGDANSPQGEHSQHNVFDSTNAGQQQGVIFWGDGTQSTTLDITLNGTRIRSESIQSIGQAISLIQSYSSVTGISVSQSGNGISFVNRNMNGTEDNMKNIDLQINSGNTAGELWNIAAAGANGRTEADYTYPAGGKDTPATTDTTWIAGAGQGGAAANNMRKTIITAHRYQYNSSAVNIPGMIDPTITNYDNVAAGRAQQALAAGNTPDADDLKHYNYALAVGAGDLLDTDARIFHSTEDLRELMQRDARYGVDYNSRGSQATEWNRDNVNQRVTLSVNSVGRYVFANPNEVSNLPTINVGAMNLGAQDVTAKSMYFQATAYRNEAAQISSNDALATIFKGLQGELDAGNQTKQSVSMVLSSYSSSLQVYDSLGTQHLIRVEWTKLETTADGGNRWQMILRIDEPANFNVVGQPQNNIIVGEVRFGNDGSLVSYDPTTISFSGNNGSAPNQLIDLNLGASGGFNGLVSNDQKSGISQQETDGYAPGMMLQGMQNKAIDQEGNIIAAFDNGIQMNIGKIAMGNVTNETGLEEIGSNLFRTTANSGSLTVGTSNTGGRGTFKSATLEMSNADLSLALTNLIVIQRGYQANSKTITTSDTMLNTLLQLKQ